MDLKNLSGWVALIGAFGLWGVAVYGVLYIPVLQKERADIIAQADQQTQLLKSSSRLHGLMNDTQEERASLHGIVTTDVVAAVDSIDAVGKAAGVQVKISNAQPDSQKAAQPTGITPVSFSIQAQGTYSQLIRFEELINSLAMPTAISQLELTRVGPAEWQMTLRIRALTLTETQQ